MREFGKGAAVIAACVFAFAAAAQDERPVSDADAAAYAKTADQYDVRILRDTWGVPHIFGQRDADAAFGLAYAHAEDDFATIQEALLMGRGTLASIKGQSAGPTDYLVSLLNVWEDVNARYETDLSAATRALCEAYAHGVNYYGSLHPGELLGDTILPVTGKDVVAGFVFRGPFFYGLDNTVMELFGDERKREISEKQKAALRADPIERILAAARDELTAGAPMGSNTFAASPERSADGSTFLNVNSHQPWTGPVAWYEAHVHSEEGWDAVGGTFPGAPVILHGHNRHLGWAHTVNKPDLADVYVLEINPDNENQYRYEGEWRDFERSEAKLEVKMEGSDFKLKVRREVLESVHGPAMRTDHGVYAIRYAGAGDIRAVEQWYRMNKATEMSEWMDAMRMQAVPSLNTGYADAEGNIYYLYNARLPIRTPGYDYEKYLPGDRAEVVWDEYLPFDKLPMVKNPPSGFVQNCNSTPFKTTIGEANPDPENFPETAGIETKMTNRALRARELFGADESISYAEFKEYKYDMRYSKRSFLAKSLKAFLESPLASSDAISGDPFLTRAVKVLRNYDLRTNPENPGAALAVLTARKLDDNNDHAEPEAFLETLKGIATDLKEVHGKVDPPWREVNRLRRGEVDLGMGGGPDVLHAVYGRFTDDGGRTVGTTGDSYVLLVQWDDNGNVQSESIHQFGSATLDEDSPHYADQAPLFVERELKPVWMDESAIRANLEAEYRPGEDP